MPRRSITTRAALLAGLCAGAALGGCDAATPGAGEPPVDARAPDGAAADGGPTDLRVPQPQPEPDPDPEPQPEPDPDPEPQPEPDPDPEPEPEPQPEPEPEPQPDPAVFDPSHLIQVELEIDPADWDALRVQSRGDLDLAGPECLAEPFPSPYDWFQARVTVDGQTYDEVAVRKKGFYGSVSASRPSVKIRFDKYVDGQTHRGLTRLTLNNGRQDQSKLRTCLAYGVFARHGVPAPRCNFARLVVNGADLGIYAHVESLQRPFLAAHFGDADGWLYEGTLSDFRPEWRGTIEQKTHEDSPHSDGIDRIIAALDADDASLLAALDDAIDLDAFLTYWATEALVGHWDGYSGNTNNFWFYEDPTDGRIRFIPWGPDGSFQPPYLFFENRRGPHSVFAIGAIARRLYLHPEGRARYIERLESLLATWDPAAVQAEIDAMLDVIRPGLRPGDRAPLAEALGELRAYVNAKADAIRAELAAGGAGWNLPLRPSLCTEPVGIVRGTFQTTWGAWPTPNTFQTGGGTFEGTLWGDQTEAANVGAAIGIGDQGAAVLIISQAFADGTITFLYVAADPALMAVDGPLPREILLDARYDCAFSLLDQRTGNVVQLATCETGQVIFDAIEQAPGAPVRGTFRIGLWGRPPE